MKKIKILIVFAVIRLLASPVGGGWEGALFAQQDPQYSQYMFNQLSLNPAFAGSREVLATTMLYRDQWVGIEGAPKTASMSIQMPLKRKKIGLGAEILSDRMGPKNISALLLSYAYRIPFLKGKLSFGLRMGVYDYAFDWSKMDYRDKADLYNTNVASSKFSGTADFGFYYYSRTFYSGLAINHINQSKVVVASSGHDSTARQAIHYFVPIGKAFQVGNTVINPTVLIKGTPHTTPQVDLSVNVLIKERIWVGVSGRSGYGLIFLTQYMITDKMKCGYSFDWGMNQIGIAGKGTHEIMIGYDLNIHGTKMLMPRYL